MKRDNKLKYAIVTGVASGIGKQVAEELNSEGIVVYGLDIDKVQEGYTTYVCDVSDEEQVVRVVTEIANETEKIDYLVNSAGMLTVGKPLSIKNMSIKQWDAIMRINLKSVMVMLKNTYPLLLKAKNPSVVNISSEQSLFPSKGFAPYSVSKAGINALTMCAAMEFLNDGIRVNSIALGTVRTNILTSLQNTEVEKEQMYIEKDKLIPFGVMNSHEVYQLVRFFLSDESKYMTGETVRCDGGHYLGR